MLIAPSSTNASTASGLLWGYWLPREPHSRAAGLERLLTRVTPTRKSPQGSGLKETLCKFILPKNQTA